LPDGRTPSAKQDGAVTVECQDTKAEPDQLQDLDSNEEHEEVGGDVIKPYC